MFALLSKLSKRILDNLSKKNTTQKSDVDYKSNQDAKQQNIKFSPNSITAKSYLECGIRKINNQDVSDIVFCCDINSKLCLEKVCRYFEIDKDTAMQRGLWMLSVVIEAEINNRKVGIISLDNDHVVSDIIPINVV